MSALGERMATMETKLDLLLDRTSSLGELSATVIRHDEQLKTIQEEILPPIKADVEENKKARWTSEGIRIALAAAAGMLGGLWK